MAGAEEPVPPQDPGGVEVAVALERNSHLHDGDILWWDEATNTVIATRIHLQDVLVITLDSLLASSAETLARTCFELGHALGNQHWPAVVKGTTVYVPLTVARQVMASVMKTHAFVGITSEFRPGSEIIPYLALMKPDDSSGADSTPHSHVQATLQPPQTQQHVDEPGNVPGLTDQSPAPDRPNE